MTLRAAGLKLRKNEIVNSIFLSPSVRIINKLSHLTDIKGVWFLIIEERIDFYNLSILIPIRLFNVFNRKIKP